MVSMPEDYKGNPAERAQAMQHAEEISSQYMTRKSRREAAQCIAAGGKWAEQWREG